VTAVRGALGQHEHRHGQQHHRQSNLSSHHILLQKNKKTQTPDSSRDPSGAVAMFRSLIGPNGNDGPKMHPPVTFRSEWQRRHASMGLTEFPKRLAWQRHLMARLMPGESRVGNLVFLTDNVSVIVKAVIGFAVSLSSDQTGDGQANPIRRHDL
jgi:hypothetical protein